MDHAVSARSLSPRIATHIPNMREELVRCLSAIQQVGHTDCICRRCAEDLRKLSHSSEYVPVWKGGRRTHLKRVCSGVVFFRDILPACRER